MPLAPGTLPPRPQGDRYLGRSALPSRAAPPGGMTPHLNQARCDGGSQDTRCDVWLPGRLACILLPLPHPSSALSRHSGHILSAAPGCCCPPPAAAPPARGSTARAAARGRRGCRLAPPPQRRKPGTSLWAGRSRRRRTRLRRRRRDGYPGRRRFKVARLLATLLPAHAHLSRQRACPQSDSCPDACAHPAYAHLSSCRRERRRQTIRSGCWGGRRGGRPAARPRPLRRPRQPRRTQALALVWALTTRLITNKVGRVSRDTREPAINLRDMCLRACMRACLPAVFPAPPLHSLCGVAEAPLCAPCLALPSCPATRLPAATHATTPPSLQMAPPRRAARR